MNKYVKLTQTDGDAVYFNIASIHRIAPSATGSELSVDGARFFVRESVEDVADKTSGYGDIV